jgi:hypothetical protein
MLEDLEKYKEYSAHIEDHLISSKIEPFQFPCVKAKPKTKTSTRNVHDPITLLANNFDQMNAQFVQS